MDKKGSAQDVIFIAVMLFVLAIGIFVIFFMVNTSVDKLVNNTMINSSAPTKAAFSSIKTISSRFDYLIFACFIGFFLAMIISGWFIGGHPIFMFIYFIIVIIGVVVSMILANTWESFTTSSIFGNTVSSFPLTNNIMTYLPMYIAIIGGLGIIVMFAKPYVEGGMQ